MVDTLKQIFAFLRSWLVHDHSNKPGLSGERHTCSSHSSAALNEQETKFLAKAVWLEVGQLLVMLSVGIGVGSLPVILFALAHETPDVARTVAMWHTARKREAKATRTYPYGVRKKSAALHIGLLVAPVMFAISSLAISGAWMTPGDFSWMPQTWIASLALAAAALTSVGLQGIGLLLANPLKSISNFVHHYFWHKPRDIFNSAVVYFLGLSGFVLSVTGYVIPSWVSRPAAILAAVASVALVVPAAMATWKVIKSELNVMFDRKPKAITDDSITKIKRRTTDFCVDNSIEAEVLDIRIKGIDFDQVAVEVNLGEKSVGETSTPLYLLSAAESTAINDELRRLLDLHVGQKGFGYQLSVKRPDGGWLVEPSNSGVVSGCGHQVEMAGVPEHKAEILPTTCSENTNMAESILLAESASEEVAAPEPVQVQESDLVSSSGASEAAIDRGCDIIQELILAEREKRAPRDLIDLTGVARTGDRKKVAAFKQAAPDLNWMAALQAAEASPDGLFEVVRQAAHDFDKNPLILELNKLVVKR